MQCVTCPSAVDLCLRSISLLKASLFLLKELLVALIIIYLGYKLFHSELRTLGLYFVYVEYITILIVKCTRLCTCVQTSMYIVVRVHQPRVLVSLH